MCALCTAPAINDAPTVKTCAQLSWKRGDENVTWKQVAEGEWKLEDNVKVRMKSRQTLSIWGVMGACYEVDHMNKLSCI